MFFFSLGIWGSFYAILLQRVLKEEKQIKSEVDNEKEMLGKKKCVPGFLSSVIFNADFP